MIINSEDTNKSQLTTGQINQVYLFKHRVPIFGPVFCFGDNRDGELVSVITVRPTGLSQLQN